MCMYIHIANDNEIRGHEYEREQEQVFDRF